MGEKGKCRSEERGGGVLSASSSVKLRERLERTQKSRQILICVQIAYFRVFHFLIYKAFLSFSQFMDGCLCSGCFSQYIPTFANGQIQEFCCMAPFTSLTVSTQGDSGGPLTTTDQSGSHTLIGILSQQLGSSCSKQVVNYLVRFPDPLAKVRRGPSLLITQLKKS